MPYPSGNEEVEFGADPTFNLIFTWDVEDQGAYEWVLVNSATGEEVATVETDTATEQHLYTFDVADIGEMFRWRYRTWTAAERAAGNVEPEWSNWYTFRLTNPTGLEITEPAAGVLATTLPTITLAFDDAGTGLVPVTQQIRVVDTATDAVTYDSGAVPWSGTNTPDPGALDASKEYRLEAEARDSRNNYRTANVVVTAPAGPAAVHVEEPDASNYESTHQITFDYWVDEVDPAWVANYIFRRRAGTTKWELVERSTVPFPGAGIENALTYTDEPYANIEWEYGVSQAVDTGA